MTLEEAKKIVKAYLSKDFKVLFVECKPYGLKDTDLYWWNEEQRAAVAYLLKNGVKPSITFLSRTTSKKTPDVSDLEYSINRLASAAKSFNDSLLDEQANKIKDLEAKLEKSDSDYIKKAHDVVVRSREISRLNDIIHKKNVMIRNLIAERGKVARELSAEKAVHQVDLQATKSAESALLYHEREYEKSLKEKDEVIDDLSRELAHSKEREEELLATIKDYLGEIEELKKGKRKPCKKAKKKMSQMHVSTPEEGRIIILSSANHARGNFFYELRKQFFKD